jgi:hypothetical protein
VVNILSHGVPYNIWEGPLPRVLIGEGVPRAITDENHTYMNAALSCDGSIGIKVTNSD